MASLSEASPVTVPLLVSAKGKDKIAMMTAYDAPTAALLDEAGLDVLLVGDSLAMTVYGEANTLSATMETMLRHAKAVSRACRRALVVGDMPFLSYQTSREQALQNAGRFLKEAGAEAVKLEGGVTERETIDAIVKAGIPVMGHVGLTPQSVHQFGGYKIQGREKDRRERVLRDALAVEEAGAFSIVLEGMPLELAKEITERLTIPTIGIGAGAHCDGQVLVIHDMLGLFDDFTPKFVKRYADLKNTVTGAAKEFIGEVKEKKFPTEEHSFR